MTKSCTDCRHSRPYDEFITPLQRAIYSWEQDFAASYTLSLRCLALRHGSARAATCWEFYFVEREGGIP